ncbi:hypothetical protein BaRGS_00020502 [Batillaria attramentaria]|uniref:Peptidase metallopeptidase domain-containing protein n=1 Tax=Batillaria attramentaria TaxID=370345 RepID=A0ABD0KMH0_9CAEN
MLQTFLEKFGYLDDLRPGQHHSPDSTREAIREFQRFNGLRVTGRMDRRTVRKMQQPRCGLPDVVKPSERPAGLRNNHDPNQPLAYYAPGYKWDKRDINYKVVQYTRQLGGNQQNNALRDAFGKWANVVPLNFRAVRSGDADIEISFVRRQHSDGPGNAFDGRAISGDTHFDDDEQWTLNEDRGTNLEIVAAHEFGHALGMGHSNVPTALMAPYYQGYDPNYSLHTDDIRGIQSLYGRGRGSSGGSGDSPRTTPRPRVTSRPRPRPTPAPRGRYCNLKFDAIAQSSDGNVYAFRRANVFLIDSSGVRSRRRTSSVFRGAPSSPGAAVYDSYYRKLYIFKGTKYWRYTGFQLDRGYPRDLPRDFQNVRAAFQWSDRGIYLFKGNNYMRWAEGLTRYSRGYPRPANQYWRGAPTNIEAALQARDGYYYFFKGRRYWKFDSRAVKQSGYPKDSRPAWLGCGTRVPR